MPVHSIAEKPTPKSRRAIMADNSRSGNFAYNNDYHLGRIDETSSSLFLSPKRESSSGVRSSGSYEHYHSRESHYHSSPGAYPRDAMSSSGFRGGESHSSAFRSPEPYHRNRSYYTSSHYPAPAFTSPTHPQHPSPSHRYESPPSSRNRNNTGAGYAYGYASATATPRLSDMNTPPVEINATAGQVAASHSKFYYDEDSYYDAPQYKKASRNHYHHHPCHHEQNTKTSSLSSIEVAPGLHLRLRGANETVAAIENDFYTSCQCTCCDAAIFCIQDADYVICPGCREVSPVGANYTMSYGEEGGVGLGFSIDALMKCQAEIVSRRVASLNYY